MASMADVFEAMLQTTRQRFDAQFASAPSRMKIDLLQSVAEKALFLARAREMLELYAEAQKIAAEAAGDASALQPQANFHAVAGKAYMLTGDFELGVEAVLAAISGFETLMLSANVVRFALALRLMRHSVCYCALCQIVSSHNISSHCTLCLYTAMVKLCSQAQADYGKFGLAQAQQDLAKLAQNAVLWKVRWRFAGLRGASADDVKAMLAVEGRRDEMNQQQEELRQVLKTAAAAAASKHSALSTGVSDDSLM